MPLPCPSCKQQLGVDLLFLMKHPISQCPHCKAVMNFEVPDDVKQQVAAAFKNIEEIKAEYKDIATFGDHKSKLI